MAVVFLINGLLFATWVSRIPGVRSSLGLGNGQLGLLLLALAAGSVLALPTTGGLIQRLGTVTVLRCAAAAAFVGLTVTGLGVVVSWVPLAAVGLFTYGIGTGVGDVAMNVEGAAVERALERSIMPRFHAAYSLGTVAGALLGALVVWLGLALVAHLTVVGGLGAAIVWWVARDFLPVDPAPRHQRSALTAWREPRTLLIGLMVLALALTEGTANDWLAVALVDGYGVEHWVGVVGFGAFVAAMTSGRIVGTRLLDRFGRVPVLWGTMATAATGICLIVFGGSLVPVIVGILLWGLGASLGFPVGISAAADDPVQAAARVSVVSTIGYTAFLAGPPLLGFLGDEVGTLHALLAVAIVLIPSALVVPATRIHPQPTAPA